MALDPHEVLRDLRAFMSRRRGDSMLLGEVNLPPKPLRAFFGDDESDEVHMLFDFPVMQAMYLALAREDARPLRRALGRRPPIPEDSQWAMFVRNHDELTLDQLVGAERAEVFAAFGSEESMQLYGRGLRRRLPAMLDGDPKRVRLVYSLLFSLPGTPVLFYGEEIGMGENLDDPRPAQRAYTDAVDRRAQRRFLACRAIEAAAPASQGAVRIRWRSTSRISGAISIRC